VRQHSKMRVHWAVTEKLKAILAELKDDTDHQIVLQHTSALGKDRI